MAEYTIHPKFSYNQNTLRYGLTGLLLALAVTEVSPENVTLSTYYPAPFGVYAKLITTADTYLASNGLGKVGIGTVTPAKMLDVAGPIRSAGHFISNSPNGAFILNAGPVSATNEAGFWFRKNTVLGEETNYTNLMRITETGNVGIGVMNPSEKLQVNGRIKITDGNQAAGRVLTSDGSGLATWQPPASGVGVIAVNVPWNSPRTIPANTCSRAIRVEMQMDAWRGPFAPNTGSAESDIRSKTFALSVNGSSPPSQRLVFGSLKAGSSGHYWGYKISLSKSFYVTQVSNTHTITGAIILSHGDASNQVTISNALYHVTCL